MQINTIQKNPASFCLSLGGVILEINSGLTLEMLSATASFQCIGIPDVMVRLIPMEKLPDVTGKACGKDAMFSYYRDGDLFYELARPGSDGSVSLAVYPASFQEITLYINEGAFPGVVRTVDKVLQLIPMKQLLAHFGAFLLHSSRISILGKAILFTAPSQTGKTTQAKLWHEYGAAKIAGNDRTLLRLKDGHVCTFGYPVDGSSPVYSNEEIPLGAIVVLKQGKENKIERLPAVQALCFLMGQTALDVWNGEEVAATQQFWLSLLELCPVYLLNCRPDEGAVCCLKARLMKDGVILDAFDTQ